MPRKRRSNRFTRRLAGCHPVALAVCFSALLTVLMAGTMKTPSPLVLGLHLPALLLLSLVLAYSLPERTRFIALLVCGPITALAFAAYPF